MSATTHNNQSNVFSRWTPENEALILKPFTYIISSPGKDMRTQLFEAFNLWLNVPLDKLQIIANVVSMLHNSSLMIDDIEDDALLRRGKPVAHKVYGIPQTINAANYVYFLALRELILLRRDEVEGPDVDNIAIDELLRLHRGQGIEMVWRDSLQCPTEDEYMEMVNNKTGGLLRIGIKLMTYWATTKREKDYITLANLIAVHFQIRDDLMNLQSKEYTAHKGFAEDLTEGKFSFPLIHGIRANVENREILDVLQKRPVTPTLKVHAVSYLRNDSGSFQYTLEVLARLEAQAREEIDRLGGNLALHRFMDKMHVDKNMFSN